MEVTPCRAFSGRVALAQEGEVVMAMGIDEAGSEVAVLGIDDVRAGRGQVGPDGGDPSIRDAHVGAEPRGAGAVQQCGRA